MLLRAIAEMLGSVIFSAPCPLCEFGGHGGRLCDDCYGALARLSGAAVCAVCSDPFPRGGRGLDDTTRCANCMGGRQFARTWALGGYEGSLRELVQRIKYGRRQALGFDLGRRVAAEMREQLMEHDVVVPIALSAARRRERGFDQAQVIARGVSDSLALPCLSLLHRQRETRSQTTLSRAGRKRNVAGAFRSVGEMEGRRLLLVDDVMTTGATADEAARCLRRAGAALVTVLVMARAGEESTSAADEENS